MADRRPDLQSLTPHEGLKKIIEDFCDFRGQAGGPGDPTWAEQDRWFAWIESLPAAQAEELFGRVRADVQHTESPQGGD